MSKSGGNDRNGLARPERSGSKRVRVASRTMRGTGPGVQEFVGPIDAAYFIVCISRKTRVDKGLDGVANIVRCLRGRVDFVAVPYRMLFNGFTEDDVKAFGFDVFVDFRFAVPFLGKPLTQDSGMAAKDNDFLNREEVGEVAVENNGVRGCEVAPNRFDDAVNIDKTRSTRRVFTADAM